MAGNHFYNKLDFGSGRYKFLIVSSQGQSLEPIIDDLTDEGYLVVDVGHQLSFSLASIKESINLPIETEDNLRDILHKNVSSDPEKPLFLHNLGILSDPSLKLEPENILKSFSRNHPLVILWDGEIEQPALLHWGFNKDTFNLNFNDISPGIILVEHEI